MIAAWASYQLVAPIRPLHEIARGKDHTIDEWADPALAGYVRWICSTRKFDAVIVNYTWLSFCFDSVPGDVFKILDTNDVFGGRRIMLEANGIVPEFFYTTEEEEAKAVARADLVWAIKPSEGDYFKRLGAKACITVLHAEPEHGWWTAPPSDDGWLRIGVIGARNNVNRRNLETFLDTAVPVFESYAAPVKVIIAGGCSQDFSARARADIEIMGRVANLADFYRKIDVVVTPMKFSTGLKIKVSEALASGAPLISHAHAMEGYPAELPAHTLPDFEQMALEIVKLAFDPAGLKSLAEASHAMCLKIQQNVLEALGETLQHLLQSPKRKVVVVAPLEALNGDSLMFDHLCSALEYLKQGADATLYLAGQPGKMEAGILRTQASQLRVLIEPLLAQKLGDDLPAEWTACAFASVLETRQIERAYFLCDLSDLRSTGSGRLRRAYIRHDAVILSGDDPFNLLDALLPNVQVVVLSAAIRRVDGALRRCGVASMHQAPCLRSGRFRSLAHRHAIGIPGTQLLILGSNKNPAVVALLALARRLETDAVVIDPIDARHLRQTALSIDRNVAPPLDVLAARLIVDVADGDEFAALIVEGALREGIPVVSPVLGSAAVALGNARSNLRPTTLGRLLNTVARGLKDEAFRSVLLSDASRNILALSANDAGWIWLRQDLQVPDRAPALSAVEALFT
jgi:hypothetical protein